MRDYRRQRRSRTINQFASQCARSEGHKVLRLCTTLFRRLGGVAGFAVAFKQELDAAREVAPGSRRVCTMLMSILRMMEAADASRPAPPDLSRLTDEELKQAQVEAVLELIQDEPSVAVSAGQILGWTVIPPDGTRTEPTDANTAPF